MNNDIHKLDERYLKIKQYIQSLLQGLPGDTVEDKVKHLKTNHKHIYDKLIGALETLKQYRTKKALYVPKNAKKPINYYVRFGRVPRNKVSYNSISNNFENGVSAYKVKWNVNSDKWELIDDHLTDVGQNTLNGFIKDLKNEKLKRPIYLLTGQETDHIGYHDGEPLLNVNTIKVIKQIDINDLFLASNNK